MRRSGPDTIAENTPKPKDARTPAQLAWRPMYQACAALWHTLSAAEKAQWESQARPKHMIGYAWFMSQCLRPNPGIYLPLAGGTMKGDIDVDSHKILTLPVPTAPTEAATKGYVDGAAVPPDYPRSLKPNIVRWILPGWYVAYFLSTQLAAGRIYYIPIFVTETTTYIRIGCNVTTLSAGNADLRIFAWENGLPGALILSAGTVSTGTTGAKEIVISQQLTRGYYFLAIRCDATPKFTTPSITYAITTPVPGMSTYAGPEAKWIIPIVDAAYADPAPAPTGMMSANFAPLTLRDN